MQLMEGSIIDDISLYKEHFLPTAPHPQQLALGAPRPSTVVGRDEKGPGQVEDRRTKKIQFAVDVEVRTLPGKDGVRTPMKGADRSGPEPTKVMDGPAPIKMIKGCAWSPGIYRALRLMGKPLDVAWEKAFIRSSHF